jgi:hypothetical protein
MSLKRFAGEGTCANCWLSFEGIEPSECYGLRTDGSTISSLDD